MQRIPALDSLQAAWLRFCAPRQLPAPHPAPPILRQTTPSRMTLQLPGVSPRCLSTATRPSQRPAFEPLSCPSASVDLACARPSPPARRSGSHNSHTPAEDIAAAAPSAVSDHELLAAAAQRVRAAGAGRGGGRGRRGRGRGRQTPAAPPAEALEPNPPEAAPSRSGTTGTRRAQATAAAEAGLGLGLEALDAVDLQATCRERVLTLQTAPTRVRGSLRTAMRAGLRLAVHPSCPHDEARGWKLFCLAPRMLLYRSPGESRVPLAELDRRCDLFRAGRWVDLLREAAAAVSTPSSRPDPAGEAARTRRATALVHLGELSAAARAP